jgi:replicative DNA helicase
MINAAHIVEKNALDEPQNVQEVLDDAQQLFFKISQSANPQSGVLIKEVLLGVKSESSAPFLRDLQEKQEQFQLRGPNDPGITGIPTLFTDFDKMINGLGNSNLMILAARPAMGKTAFALNIAENVCFKNQIPVGIFSLEMSADQLVHRLICSQSEVESDKIKTGSLNGVEFQRVVASVNEMQKYTMVIDDQPGLKITDLRARARRMKESYGIGFLVIDYLQLISGSGTRSSENRQNEISEISRLLKNLARELNIPILCLSQLSRKVEERPGHRPMMSDLRESGSIEQDADMVMFLLRREYYDPNDKPGMAELIIGKNRHGGVGIVNLTYRKEIVQFANYTALKYQPNSPLDQETEAAFSHFSPN